MTSPDPDALLDAIASLALDMARQCPEIADQASRIAAMAREVRSLRPERGAIQDALDAEMVDTDVSDVHVRATADAVISAVKGSD